MHIKILFFRRGGEVSSADKTDGCLLVIRSQHLPSFVKMLSDKSATVIIIYCKLHVCHAVVESVTCIATASKSGFITRHDPNTVLHLEIQ